MIVGDNGKPVAKQVLTPLLDGGSNREQFSDVCRWTEKLRAKWFAEKSYGVPLLGKDRTHINYWGIYFDRKWKLEVQ